jgi:pilus assembly protein CpaB
VRWRLVVVLVSVLVALVGALGVLRYAQGADERALAGQEARAVLVVGAAAPIGTPVEALVLRVELVPAVAVPDGAVTSLESFAGAVTAVDLVVGEVLLAARLTGPDSVEGLVAVEVPAGAQAFTFPVAIDVALGGRLGPGDRIAVYASFDDAALGGGPGGDGAEGLVSQSSERDAVSALLVPELLVLDVQATSLPRASSDDSGASTSLAPEGALLLTVAIDVATAERLVFALEFGTVRIARLTDRSVLEGSDPPTLGSILG